MKAILLTFVFLCLSLFVQAQTLNGVVYDRTNGEPVAGAAVYLDGTTLYALTNARGEYEICARQVIHAPLIFQHLSYETHTETTPFATLPDTVFLLEKISRIDEIIVYSSPFTRKQMLEAFRENFLGANLSKKQCFIRNEDDIELWYEAGSHTLRAEAKRPLIIHNRYLGYEISYDLIRFETVYSQPSLREEHVSKVLFLGPSSFADLAPEKKRVQRRRWEAFQHSGKQFFWLMSRNGFGQSEYKIAASVDPENRNAAPPGYGVIADIGSIGFAIADSGAFSLLTPTRPPLRRKPPAGFDEKTLYAHLKIVHRQHTPDQSFSEIFFLNDSYAIDGYGNIAPVPDLVASGVMAQKRVGEMLPIDYLPEER